MTSSRLLSLAGVFTLVLAAACAKKGPVVGSCDMRDGKKENNMCLDFIAPEAERGAIEKACSPGRWSNKPCSRELALGGCLASATGTSSIVTWEYRHGDVTTAAQAKEGCSPADTFVAADWVPPQK